MRQTNVRGSLSLRGFRKLRTGAIVATGVILLGLGFLAPTVSANEQDGVWVARTVAEVKADIQNINNLSHYTIKWGDTLSAISGATGLSVDSLVEINRIANRDLIFANNKLYFSEEAFLKDGNTEVKRQQVSIDNSGSRQSYEVETKTDTVTGEQTTTVKQTTPVVVETPAVSSPKVEEPSTSAPAQPAEESPAPAQPTEESPAAPGTTETPAPTKPTEESPAAPGATETPTPAAPAEETPAAPGTTETPAPAQPAEESPAAPGATETPTPAAPAEETPAVPGTTETPTPATPAEDHPATSGTTETLAPATPAEETPAAPGTTEQPAPAAPAEGSPAAPGVTETPAPKKPTEETTAAPGTTETPTPAAPAEESPAAPGATEQPTPAQPTEDTTGTPDLNQPAKENETVVAEKEETDRTNTGNPEKNGENSVDKEDPVKKAKDDSINENIMTVYNRKLEIINKLSDENKKNDLKRGLEALKNEAVAAITEANDEEKVISVTEYYQNEIDGFEVPGEEFNGPDYSKEGLSNGRNDGTTIDGDSTAIGHGSGEVPSESTTKSTEETPTAETTVSEGEASGESGQPVEGASDEATSSSSDSTSNEEKLQSDEPAEEAGAEPTAEVSETPGAGTTGDQGKESKAEEQSSGTEVSNEGAETTEPTAEVSETSGATTTGAEGTDGANVESEQKSETTKVEELEPASEGTTSGNQGQQVEESSESKEVESTVSGTESEETGTSGETSTATQPVGEEGKSETTEEASNTSSEATTPSAEDSATGDTIAPETSTNTEETVNQSVDSSHSGADSSTSVTEDNNAETNSQNTEASTGDGNSESLNSDSEKLQSDAPAEEHDGSEKSLEKETEDSNKAAIDDHKKLAEEAISTSDLDDTQKQEARDRLNELTNLYYKKLAEETDFEKQTQLVDEYETLSQSIQTPGATIEGAADYTKPIESHAGGTTIDENSTVANSALTSSNPSSQPSSSEDSSQTQPAATSDSSTTGNSGFRSAGTYQPRVTRRRRSIEEPQNTVSLYYNFDGMKDIPGFFGDPGEDNTVTIPAGTSKERAKELVEAKIQAKVQELNKRGYTVKKEIVFEQDTDVKNFNYVVTFTKETTGTTGFRMAPAVQPRASRNRRSLEQPAPQKVKVNVFYNFDKMKDIAGFLGYIDGTSLEVAAGSTNEEVKAAVKSQVDAKKEELSKRGYTFKEDYVYQANGKDYNYVVTFSKAAK
ncbi:hypothetical protein SP4011_16740 [Streptococcus parapneumoniae]|uniref:LysM domain-containing protein n=1 Tax=Streptococcus parapneumoniae TaxID=2993430 RepID=A0ABM8CIE7_9STRE|nr:hypothetical protein SP4011_16740 [Streptococcus sp. SP4011]